MRIVTVVGARPQFVKASVVSQALGGCPGVSEVLVHTGQHYDENMSAVFFEELGIPEPAEEGPPVFHTLATQTDPGRSRW